MDDHSEGNWYRDVASGKFDIEGRATDEEVVEKLKNNKNEFVLIGGTGAVSSKIENIISKYDASGASERIYGKTRYETSVAIAKAFFNKPTEVIVAYAINFPDGLAGGPLGVAKNAPVILTAPKNLKQIEAYVDENKINSGVVLGGTALLTDADARTIFNMAKDYEIMYNRYVKK